MIKHEPLKEYTYDGFGTCFCTTDKKFALLAYKHIKKLADKAALEAVNAVQEEIEDAIEEVEDDIENSKK